MFRPKLFEISLFRSFSCPGSRPKRGWGINIQNAEAGLLSSDPCGSFSAVSLGPSGSRRPAALSKNFTSEVTAVLGENEPGERGAGTTGQKEPGAAAARASNLT